MVFDSGTREELVAADREFWRHWEAAHRPIFEEVLWNTYAMGLAYIPYGGVPFSLGYFYCEKGHHVPLGGGCMECARQSRE